MSTGNGWYTPVADISQHRDIVMIQLLNLMKKKLETKSKLAYFKLKMNSYRSRKSERLLNSLGSLIPTSESKKKVKLGINSQTTLFRKVLSANNNVSYSTQDRSFSIESSLR
jgi:hypothetical protein